MSNNAKIFSDLERIAPLLPSPLLWGDRNNIVLGCNDLVFRTIGATESREQLIGKAPHEYLPKDIADIAIRNVNQVIQEKKAITFEESIKDIQTGKIKYLLMARAPLFDDNGVDIVGTIVSATDITDRKEKERLEIETELQKAKIEEQLKFKKLVDQAAQDTKSNLAILLILAQQCIGLTNKEIFGAIERFAVNAPIGLYWFDENNVLFGANKLDVELIGATSVNDCIGKTPYDFFPFEIADNVVKHNNLVMRTGKILSQEETIKDITTGEIKYCLAFKAPLYSKDGESIGILCTSVDITAEKNVERLKLESAEQKVKLQEQENFRKVADQVVHDIRSPLASLLMIVKSCDDIPESERIALREAATGIGDIANNLLSKYKKEDEEVHGKKESRQPVMVSLTLLQLLTDKKYQYQNLPVKFNHDFCQRCNFAFIQVEPTSFKRMMSNLLNNAVDAFEGKAGKVNLKLNVNSKQVKISIQDNGKGMPPEIIDKIMSNISFTSGKQGGSGIGLTQVRETLQRNEGKFEIKSKVGKGATVILTFPRVASPEWIAEEIKLNKGDTVVILDDDASIHGAWKTRFKDYEKQVYLKHFTLGQEAVSFINSFSEKRKIFLLTDFELLKQELNGLHVIEQTKISRSILVTSHYANYTVRELAAKTGTKILPKQLASEVPITIGESEVAVSESEEIAQRVTGDLKKVDLIIIDDNKSFADSLALCFRARDKVVDTYYSPQQLLEQVQQYPKDTKICTDHDLRSSMNGVDLAKKLYEYGYTNLYLLSGWDFDKGAIPDYLTVISKSDTDSITKLAE